MEKTIFKPTAADELIREFCQDYMEKLFYFCLKKTGNPTEAEDLCSDVSLQVIAGLKKGTVPDNFPAWVWQIARNRYRLWAIVKHRAAELYDTEAETDGIPDDTIGVEDELILAEDMNLLRRELAFISSDYRNILVAYYIEDRSIRDISSSLKLPEGTVKTKLYRARKLLKEGINMAREFGPKSYKPENVYFTAGGPQPTGLPWSAVQRRVSKNILLEAADNPSAVEELAVALGIAVPYMEDEVNDLVRATLLKKTGNKYVTNFPFVSKETQEKARAVRQAYVEEHAELIDRIVSDVIPKIRESGTVRNGRITDDEIKWWAVPCFAKTVEYQLGYYKSAVERENGEKWQFIGYENTGVDFQGVSENGWGNDDVSLDVYVPHEYFKPTFWGNNTSKMSALPYLAKVIKSGSKKSDLSDAELDMLSSLRPLFHFGEDGSVIPDVLVFDSSGIEMVKAFLEHPLYEKLAELDGRIHGEITEIVKSESNAYVQSQLGMVADCLSQMLADTVRKLVDLKKLTVPEDTENTTCTAALLIY